MVPLDYLFPSILDTKFDVSFFICPFSFAIKPEKEEIFRVGVLVSWHEYFPDTATDAIRTFKKSPKCPILLDTTCPLGVG